MKSNSVQTTIIGFICLVAASCSTDQARLTDVEQPSHIVTADQQVGASQQNTLEILASHLARALTEPGVANAVLASMNSSPFPELKQEVKQGPGAMGLLLDAAVRSGEVTQGELARLLTSLPRLELYFPVESHRKTWRGTPDVLLAAALDDDHSPVAFDAQGNRHVLSKDSPPSRATMVVGRAETDFTRVPAASPMLGGVEDCEEDKTQGFVASGPVQLTAAAECGGSGGGSTCADFTIYTPGIYLTCLQLNDVHEPWYRGNPEIEVHVYRGSGGTLAFRHCSGEHTPSAQFGFDMNSGTWQGSVQLLEESWGPNDKWSLIIWEDDAAGSCTGTSSGLKASNSIQGVFAASVAGYLILDNNVIPWGDPGLWALAVAVSMTAWALDTDDLVGNMRVPTGGSGDYNVQVQFPEPTVGGGHAFVPVGSARLIEYHN